MGILSCCAYLFGTLFILIGIGALAATSILPGTFNAIWNGALNLVITPLGAGKITSQTNLETWAGAGELGNGGYTGYWISNVTNYDAVMTTGAVPIIEDIGPYVFNTWTRKYDYSASELANGDEVLHARDFSYHNFNTSLSCAEATGGTCVDLDDDVTIVNTAYVGLMATIKELLGGDDSLMTAFLTGGVFDSISSGGVGTQIQNLVSSIFFPAIVPYFVSNHQTAVMASLPYVGLLSNNFGDTTTLTTYMDNYSQDNEVIKRHSGASCQYDGAAGLSGLDPVLKGVLYTASQTSAMNNANGYAMYFQLSLGYMGAYKQVYPNVLAGASNNVATACAAMKTATYADAVVANTPNVTLLGTTYVLKDVIDNLNAAAAAAKGSALTQGLTTTTIHNFMQVIWNNGIGTWPILWNGRTNLSAIPNAPADVIAANLDWMKGNPLQSTILGGSSSTHGQVATALWGLENPLSNTNKASFMYETVAEAKKLYTIVLGTIAAGNNAVTWLNTNKALLLDLNGVVRWWAATALTNMVTTLGGGTALPTTAQATLGGIQQEMVAGAITDFNTYTNNYPAMTADMASNLTTNFFGAMALGAATNGANVDLLKIFSGANCPYVPQEISDTGPLQFACGEIMGLAGGVPKDSINKVATALGSHVPEWYDITGFTLTNTTFTFNGNTVSVTSRERYNKLYNFMMGGDITDQVYTDLGAIGTSLKATIAQVAGLLSSKPGLAKLMGNVIFANNIAKVCATLNDNTCKILTGDMGYLTISEAIALNTYWVDTLSKNILTSIEGSLGGVGGPYMKTKARNVLVEGFKDPTLTYLRPSLPASLGVPDSPAGPHLLERSRKDAKYSILNTILNQTALDNEKKRLDEDTCAGGDKSVASNLMYGGNQGMHSIYNAPVKKATYQHKRDGSIYGARGACNGAVWNASTNNFGFEITIDGLPTRSMPGHRNLIKNGWPTTPYTGFEDTASIFFSFIQRPIELKFLEQKKDKYGQMDIREFGYKTVPEQSNLTVADKALHTAGYKCLYDITAGSTTTDLDVFFGEPHLNGCKDSEMAASTVYRAPTYLGGRKIHNSTYHVDPITGLFVGVDAKVSTYFVVDPMLYSTFHPGLCNAQAWPARTTAAGCTQNKKQIVPLMYARSIISMTKAQATATAVLFNFTRYIFTIPTMIQNAGIAVLVIGIIFIILGCTACKGSSSVEAK